MTNELKVLCGLIADPAPKQLCYPNDSTKAVISFEIRLRSGKAVFFCHKDFLKKWQERMSTVMR